MASQRQLSELPSEFARTMVTGLPNLPSFVKVAKPVAGYRFEIIATLICGVNNALVASVNTKIRLITRRAFGFRNVNAPIALAQQSLGGYRPGPTT